MKVFSAPWQWVWVIIKVYVYHRAVNDGMRSVAATLWVRDGFFGSDGRQKHREVGYARFYLSSRLFSWDSACVWSVEYYWTLTELKYNDKIPITLAPTFKEEWNKTKSQHIVLSLAKGQSKEMCRQQIVFPLYSWTCIRIPHAYSQLRKMSPLAKLTKNKNRNKACTVGSRATAKHLLGDGRC